MSRPVCAKCHIEMSCARNDSPVVHYMNNIQSNGIDYVQYGDRYICKKCGADIVTGFGNKMLGLDLTTASNFSDMVRTSVDLVEVKL